MKRALLILAAALTGCGGDPAPVTSAPASPTPEAAPAAPSGDEITLKEAEFYLYDNRAPMGAAQKPTVTIRAGEQTLGTGDIMSYAFKDVTAILHLPEEKEITFQAAEGTYVEGQKAFLKGGVMATVNELKIELEDVEMTAPNVNSPGIAFSDHPAVLSGPGIELTAENLRLYPEEKELELRNGAGFFEFGRFQQ